MQPITENSKPLLFLILEDHPEVAENNCLFLQKQEPMALCTVVNNHTDALECIKLEMPNLVIVDLLFGTLTGAQYAIPSLNFLRQVFQDYPLLNILIYTSEYNYLKPLSLLCQHSLTDKAIAQQLNLSLKSVQNCVQRLKMKMDIDYLDENTTSARVALCMQAVRLKLILL